MQQRQCIRHRHALARHRDVHALAAQYRNVLHAVIQSSRDVTPRPGRIHHDACAHFGPRTGHGVHHACTGDHAVRIVHERRHARMVQCQRSRLRRRHHVRKRQAHVIRTRVPVARAADQPVGIQAWLALQDRMPRHAAVRTDVAKQRQRIVRQQPRTQLPPRNARAAIHRPHEAQRTDQVRRDLQQRAPLTTGLEYHVQVPVLQIAHAAMHQS